ncbi:MAG: glycoside hydrolase family 2 TIM barrel-domain containing protein [Actinomycetota bacterium]
MQMPGRWVATEATDDIRRFGIELDQPDDDPDLWRPVDVPGHWQRTAAFADASGPLMYRCRFESEPPAEGRRRWITLDGVMYQADAWLDGAYLGDPEGYFFPHSFDITDLARIGDNHVLAVEVACPEQRAGARTNITGLLQSWRGLPDGWNPGGIWRPVRMYETGPVRIDRLKVLCRDADERSAHVLLTAHLDSDAIREVTVVTRRDGDVVDEQQAPVAVGANELAWSLDVRRPDLWWPAELGEQHLTEFEVEVLVDGEHSDRRRRRTGLRQVAWTDWVCSVNGERVFLRGVNVTPLTVGIADTTDDVIERDLALAIDLGVNAIRVRGHISRRCLYDRADELGLLVLQDFPLEGPQSRTVRSRATTQALTAVDALGHHPSLILWSGHNEPTDTHTSERSGWRGTLGAVAVNQLPSWNRSVLDRWVKRSFERSDPTRRASAYSGVGPHLPRLVGSDTHLWYGWRYGESGDLARRARRQPSSVRFVSEFGADSVPDAPTWIDRELDDGRRWPLIDWDDAESAAGYDRATFESMFPPQHFDSLDEWRRTTQLYQSGLLKTQIETLRRLKYRPTGGFCISSLADAAPVVSDSLYDHERRPKDAVDAVRAACAPVIVVADELPDWVNPGDPVRVAVHLVNDRRVPLDATEVAADATWPGGSMRRRFGGPIGADDVVMVGTIELTVPDTLGELAIELTATSVGDVIATNRYTTAIVVPTEP